MPARAFGAFRPPFKVGLDLFESARLGDEPHDHLRASDCKELRKETVIWYATKQMGSSVSTITSKYQITLPEDVRKKFHVDIGGKILWEVQGDILIGKRLPSLMDLAGCLKSDKPPATEADFRRAWPDAAVAREKRIKNQK